MKSLFEQMGGTYTQCGDYLLPDIELPPQEERPIGIDVLSVPRHHKNGALVSAHLHLNVTYLFYGDPALSLSHKADEVKGARWFDVEAIPRIVKEKAMLPVYAKLCERARTL